ncbi:DUF4864 domain-containing protein [Granulosicoccus antarcticus]|nr:DUF4864 domain-containing protein [Granulosicoccus antarcticus]
MAYSQTSLASSRIIEPNENFTPQQVVQIVVDSLKHNDADNDAGIATVFRFASPANKISTGPLNRFRAMIKKGFPDMLNHSNARYEAMKVSGNTAIQAVWLMTHSGKEIGYAFQLSKQSGGQNANMWLTDRVIPLGIGKESGLRI